MKWGVLWKQENILDGEQEHLIYRNGVPIILQTRKEARAWINKNYGYIKERKDLQEEPHGWKMPIPVKLYFEHQK